MDYNCKIIKIIEDLEVIINISGCILRGHDIYGTLLDEGVYCTVELNFFDDIEINECNEEKPNIIYRSGFEYDFIGRLDFDSRIVKSLIDIELEQEDLFDYAYLDGEMVNVNIKRIDFIFPK